MWLWFCYFHRAVVVEDVSLIAARSFLKPLKEVAAAQMENVNTVARPFWNISKSN